jgi:amino acid transporter
VDTNPALKRDIGVPTLVLVAVVGAVGTGVLFGTAGIAAEAGPAVIAVWIMAGIIYLPIALMFVPLARAYPETGGPARYPYYTHGYLTTLISGVADLVWFLLIPPIEAIAAVEGINSFYPHFLNAKGDPTLAGALAAVGLIIVFVPFNYFGVSGFRRSSNYLGVLKTIAYLTLAFALVSFGFGANLTRYGGFAPFGGSSLLPGVALAAFGVGGVRCVLNFLEEMKEPHRFNQVIFWSVAGQVFINVVFGLSIVLGLDWHQVHLRAGDWAGVGKLPGNPFLVIVRASHTHWLVPIVAVVAILGPFVTGYIYQGSGIRVLTAMGRSRVSPQLFGAIDERRRIPARALVGFTVVAVVLAFLTAPVPQIYGLINDAVVAGYFAVTTLPATLLVTVRNATGHLKPATVVLAAFGVCASSFIVYWSGWPAVPYSMIVIAVLTVVFTFARPKGERSDWHNSIWFIVQGAFLVLMSAIGSVGKLDTLSLPIGTVVVAVVSVAVFLPWGYVSRIRTVERVEALRQESLGAAQRMAEL